MPCRQIPAIVWRSKACGELAGDPLPVPVLVGLGVRELSMNPANIPQVKEIIGRIRIDAAKALAEQILPAESAPAARALAQAFFE